MPSDIGLRNHRAVVNNGIKVVNKLRSTDLDRIASRYEQLLQELDLLFKTANLLENR